jgi:uncharacterized DUF497 family protein
MRVEFDPEKDAANGTKHGISLARTADLEILHFVEDVRSYGERRFWLFGLIEGVAYCATVTFRKGVTRTISLRRASRVERKRYDLEA